MMKESRTGKALKLVVGNKSNLKIYAIQNLKMIYSPDKKDYQASLIYKEDLDTVR